MTEESRRRFDCRSIIQEHLENVRNYIRFQMDAYGRNARGDNGGHISPEKLFIKADYGSGALYGLKTWNYMETGRAGGRVPRNFASIIYQWSIDKGIQIDAIPYVRGGKHKYTPEERGRWSFAGAVANKIMRSGTSIYRYGVREDIYSSAINRECAAILEESSLRVAEIIENINKNA